MWGGGGELVTSKRRSTWDQPFFQRQPAHGVHFKSALPYLPAQVLPGRKLATLAARSHATTCIGRGVESRKLPPRLNAHLIRLRFPDFRPIAALIRLTEIILQFLLR